jgi:hypothetical protein
MCDLQRRRYLRAGCAIVIAAVCGCEQRQDRRVSQFRVINKFSKTIIVSNWVGLERNGPAVGVVVAGGRSEASYGIGTKLPEKTVVTWHVQVDSGVTWTADIPKKVFQQEVILVGAAPADQRGVMEFILDEDGIWTVVVDNGE